MELGWRPNSAASLRAVASVDPRPETVEDVLNVCPQQASTFGGRHLRLAWICSPPDATQGWPGRNGVARVRVDTALRPQDPAVLLIPGLAGTARDPVVDLRVSVIPPHFVQPWASVEIVRDSRTCSGVERRLGGGNGQPGGGGSSGGGGEPDDPALTGLRPESALELLRGSVVRTGGVVYLLATPTDVTCRGVTLLCQRAPEFAIPTVAPGPAPGGGGGSGGSVKVKDNSGSGRPRNIKTARERGGGGGGDVSAGERQGARGMTRGGASSGGGATAHDNGESELVDRDGREGKDGSHRRHGGHSAPSVNAAVGSRGGGFAGGSEGARGGKDEEEPSKEGDWAGMLAEWGVVTARSEVVVPHKALEVWYHDAAPETSSEGEPDWVETVLRSHAPSVIDDVSAGLQLPPSASGVGSALGVSEEEAEREREAANIPWDDVGVGSGGALLVHGPPGVGKTLLVEALARRLRCRLVKVSPGRLAAAAGVGADRVLSEAFRYCRQCASHRVLLLLDAMDRLIPASEGSVGASRGDVDAGVLNALVLEVEQGRRYTSRRGHVAIVGVTSWPDQVHPTARRCAGQEVVALPPSQPLRGDILRRALPQAGGKTQAWAVEEDNGSPEMQDAFAEVVGLCQGFTAGDMCAVAAAAVDLSASRPPQHRGHEALAGEEFHHSYGEALRAGFRQVRRRVIAGRGGAGGGGDGGSAAVTGVPSVRWSEVGGLERAKSAVQEMVVWPARFPETFSRMGISPASGILLFGPPGTGKTLLAKAAATETGATFIELKISDVVRGEVGESEKAVDRAFRTARELAPSIIFIDEFQALFASRDASGGTGSRLASQLLVCMDELARWRAAGLRASAGPASGKRRDDVSNLGGRPGCVDGSEVSAESAAPATTTAENKGSAARAAVQSASANVMVLAATNAPGAVDAAFLRPGRFDEIVYAGLPDLKGRQHILRAAKAQMEGIYSPEVSPSPAIAIARISSSDTTSCKTLPAARTGPDTSTPSTAAAAIPVAAAAAATAATTDASIDPPEWAESRQARTRGKSTGDGYRGGKWASDVDTAWLSQQTEGYSGADLSSLVRNAAMASLRAQDDEHSEGGGGKRRVSPNGSDNGAATEFLVLARRHFETALASTRPSSGPEVVARHESWARQWYVE